MTGVQPTPIIKGSLPSHRDGPNNRIGADGDVYDCLCSGL